MTTLLTIKSKSTFKAEKSPGCFKNIIKGLGKTKYLQLMLLPGLIYYIIFHYIPIYGISIAFIDYKISRGFFGSPWVGLEHFERFWSNPYLLTLVRNTFLINVYSLLWSFPAPILLAVFLNELKNGMVKKFVQTVSYLPHFISTVTVVSLLTLILSPTTGIVNSILERVFNIEPIYFMGEASWFRTIFISSGIWQNVGFGAIIYIAALSNINPELYESAFLDGATRIQKIFYISLPSIKPTVMLLLILNIGGLLSSSTEKIYLMYNPITYEVADVLGTYIFRRGIEMADYSYSAAVGLLNSLANFVLLVLANTISSKLTDESLW